MGGAALLFRHDLRVAWRDFRGAFRIFRRRGFLALVVVLVLVMHAAGWSAVNWLEATRGPDGVPALAPGVLFVLLLMVAQSLNGVTRALYGRGDLDLLVSSPVSTRPLLFVRALAIACGAVTSAAIFVVPVADVAAFLGEPRWLAMLPALVAGALAATAVGLLVAIALFAAIGPKRARLGAQILATFIGGGFMLSVQLDRMIPHASSAFRAWLGAWPRVAALLALPVQAAAGEVGPLIVWCGGGIVLFAGVTLGLGPHVLDLAMRAGAAEGAEDARPRRRRRAADRAFRTEPVAALRRKEWRIILRDPWIVSQILLQLLYISPLFLVLWQGGALGGSPVVALAPTIVVVSFQLAASLTWLGLSGEDAPEMMRTAPVPARLVHRAKIQAVAGLTALVAGPLLLWLSFLSPLAAMGTLVLALFAGLAAIALNTWHARPTRRGSFAARHRESKLLALVEMAMSILLGITAALGVAGSAWLLVPLAAIGLILLANRPRAGIVPELSPVAG